MKSAERVRKTYEKMAPNYDRKIEFWERRLFADGRQWVCDRAKGDVLEIAVGTGRNLPHYPEDVRLSGIELSPAMLGIARRQAAELGRDADLLEGDAQALPFPDRSFDTVVCTLSLCTIPDDRRAIAEAERVLRPGGRLVLLEHVRSPLLGVRAFQWLLEPIARLLGGDHLTREPLEGVRAAGFDVEALERSKLGIVERLVARKAASP